MASAHSPSYPLGGTQAERDRLLTQAEQSEPTADWLLDQIGIRPGWRAVDIGLRADRYPRPEQPTYAEIILADFKEMREYEREDDLMQGIETQFSTPARISSVGR